MNFGGLTEGKASLNVATPDRTQEFSVDVGNLGVSFDKKIETKKDNTLEQTTTLSGSALFF